MVLCTRSTRVLDRDNNRVAHTVHPLVITAHIRNLNLAATAGRIVPATHPGMAHCANVIAVVVVVATGAGYPVLMVHGGIAVVAVAALSPVRPVPFG